MATTTAAATPTPIANIFSGKAPRRCGIASACAAAIVLVLCPARLPGQARGAQVTARLGIAVPDDAYQVNCGHSSLAFGVDIQGRRRLFPQLSVDQFTGSGGGDEACLPILPGSSTVVGGLRLDGSTRVGLGVGARVQRGPIQLEGAVLGGVITGRRGFTQAAADDDRGIMPQVGGQASLVFFRWVVLSAATSWTRLTLDLIPSAGRAQTFRTSWSPMTTAQLGVRWGVGSAKGRD